jgi:hypothetical protein
MSYTVHYYADKNLTEETEVMIVSTADFYSLSAPYGQTVVVAKHNTLPRVIYGYDGVWSYEPPLKGKLA